MGCLPVQWKDEAKKGQVVRAVKRGGCNLGKTTTIFRGIGLKRVCVKACKTVHDMCIKQSMVDNLHDNRFLAEMQEPGEIRHLRLLLNWIKPIVLHNLGIQQHKSSKFCLNISEVSNGRERDAAGGLPTKQCEQREWNVATIRFIQTGLKRTPQVKTIGRVRELFRYFAGRGYDNERSRRDCKRLNVGRDESTREIGSQRSQRTRLGIGFSLAVFRVSIQKMWQRVTNTVETKSGVLAVFISNTIQH